MSKKCLFNVPLPRSESSATMWDLLCFCSLEFFAWYPWKSTSTIKRRYSFFNQKLWFLLSIGNFQILQNLGGSILLLVCLVFKPSTKKAYNDSTIEVPHEAAPGNPRIVGFLIFPWAYTRWAPTIVINGVMGPL